MVDFWLFRWCSPLYTISRIRVVPGNVTPISGETPASGFLSFNSTWGSSCSSTTADLCIFNGTARSGASQILRFQGPNLRSRDLDVMGQSLEMMVNWEMGEEEEGRSFRVSRL